MGDSCAVLRRQGLSRRGLLSYYGAMRLLLSLSLAVIFLSAPGFGKEKPGEVDFLEDVRPILAGKCFPCHGPDKAKRKSSLRLDTAAGVFSKRKSGHRVVVPGDPDASLLIERIETSDQDELMPPVDSELALSPVQVDILRRWVDSGAQWKEHWAYKVPVRPSLPRAEGSGWVRNPVDAFVLSRLEKENLAPAPAASSTTLLRRLWLDPPLQPSCSAAWRTGAPTPGRRSLIACSPRRILASARPRTGLMRPGMRTPPAMLPISHARCGFTGSGSSTPSILICLLTSSLWSN